MGRPLTLWSNKAVLLHKFTATGFKVTNEYSIATLSVKETEIFMFVQADLKALQPRVVYLDQQRTKLSGANSELKQKIAALQQETGFKDGEHLGLAPPLSIQSNIGSGSATCLRVYALKAANEVRCHL